MNGHVLHVDGFCPINMLDIGNKQIRADSKLQSQKPTDKMQDGNVIAQNNVLLSVQP